MKNNGFGFLFMNKEIEEVQKFKDAVGTILDYRYSNGNMVNIDTLRDVSKYISTVIGDGLDDWLSGDNSEANSKFLWVLNVKDLVKEYFTNRFDSELTDADIKKVEALTSLVLIEEIKSSVILVLRELILVNCPELIDVSIGNYRSLLSIDEDYNMTIDTKDITKESATKSIIAKNNTVNNWCMKRHQLKINGEIEKYEKPANRCYDAFLDEVEIYFEKIARDNKYISNFTISNAVKDGMIETQFTSIVRHVFFCNMYEDAGLRPDDIRITENGKVMLENFDVVGFEITKLIKDDKII